MFERGTKATARSARIDIAQPRSRESFRPLDAVHPRPAGDAAAPAATPGEASAAADAGVLLERCAARGQQALSALGDAEGADARRFAARRGARDLSAQLETALAGIEAQSHLGAAELAAAETSLRTSCCFLAAAFEHGDAAPELERLRSAIMAVIPVLETFDWQSPGPDALAQPVAGGAPMLASYAENVTPAIATIGAEPSPEAVRLARAMDTARGALAVAVRRVLARDLTDELALAQALADEVPNDAELAALYDEVAVAASAAGTDVYPAGMRANLAILARQLDAVRVSLPASGGDVGYAGALRVLRTHLADGRASAGVELFLDQIGADVVAFLIQGLALPSVLGLDPEAGSVTLEELSNRLDRRVQPWGDSHGLLELELAGTLRETSRAAAAAETGETQSERAIAGHRLGEAARLGLLIRARLQALPPDPVPSIGDLADGRSVAQTLSDADRTAAAGEEDTLRVLDDDPALLAPTRVKTRQGRGTIAPEQAFPEHTDKATRGFLAELADRVQIQAGEVRELREQIVPASPTYSLAELMAVHGRWFQFFSCAGRDADPYFAAMKGTYDYLFESLNLDGPLGLGFSAAILRGVFMHAVAPDLERSQGEAQLDFQREIRAGGLARNESVTGSATAPEYDGRDTFAGRSGEEFATAQVERRRVQIGALQHAAVLEAQAGAELPAVSKRVAERARAAGLVSPHGDPRALHFLPPEEAREADEEEAWRYFISITEDDHSLMGLGRNLDEEKAVSPGVYRYLLALAEHLETINVLHEPTAGGGKVGDRETRAHGLEGGDPTSAERLLEGEKQPRDHFVEADQHDLEQAWEAGGSEANTFQHSGMDAEVLAMVILTRELTGYLDAFFANASPVDRFGAILVIAEREYGISEDLRLELVVEDFVNELLEEAAIALALFALARLGWVGMLLSTAIGKGLEFGGKLRRRATIGSFLLWFARAMLASDFAAARVNAALLTPMVGELRDLALEEVAGAVVDLGKTGAGAALKKLGSSEGGEVDMAMLARLATELAGDPSVSKAALDGFETRLKDAMRDGGDPPPDAFMCMDIIRNLDAKRHTQLLRIYPALADANVDLDATLRGLGEAPIADSARHHEAYEASPDLREAIAKHDGAEKPKRRRRPVDAEALHDLREKHGLDEAGALALLEVSSKRTTKGEPLVGAEAIKAHFDSPDFAADLPGIVVQRRDGRYVGVEVSTETAPDLTGILTKFESFAALAEPSGKHMLGRFEIYLDAGATLPAGHTVEKNGELAIDGQPVRIYATEVAIKRRELAPKDGRD